MTMRFFFVTEKNNFIRNLEKDLHGKGFFFFPLYNLPECQFYKKVAGIEGTTATKTRFLRFGGTVVGG